MSQYFLLLLFSGKSVGIVTTTRITHATPGSTYSHTPERNWENDNDKTKDGDNENCKDIALQLIEDNSDINVSVLVDTQHAFIDHPKKKSVFSIICCSVNPVIRTSKTSYNYCTVVLLLQSDSGYCYSITKRFVVRLVCVIVMEGRSTPQTMLYIK